MKYDVFISYRRDGGEQTAKMIRDSLSDLGYNVFFDVESLNSGNFNTKLYSVIDECSDFILVLSPKALDRCSSEEDWVRREVEYALSKDKNIVPILLRGFDFDAELPKSMEILPQLNGIQASTEFYDAFIKKLQKFLKAKPTVARRLTQNSLVRKTLPLFIALALVVGIVFGVKLISEHFSDSYPRTKAEEKLTKEVVYCVGTNLTGIEIVADSSYNAIEAVERQLQVNSADNVSLHNTLDVCRNSINGVDESNGMPDAGFIERMASSPFDSADITAMNEVVASFKSEWLDNIDYLEFVASDACMFPKETKLEIVSNYKKYLDETLDMYACLTNMLFTGVTDKQALKDLHSEILPGLRHIPLNSQNWSNDIDVLKDREKEHGNTLNEIILDMSVLTGNISVQTPQPEQTTQAETEKTTEDSAIAELKNEIRRECLPKDGDNADQLWIKMMNLLSIECYNDARDCIEMYRKVADDPDADAYLKSLNRFIDHMEKEGVMYGVIVQGYYEPDGINEKFKIGDIIVSLNGEQIRTFEEYDEKKSQLNSDKYELGVLRLNANGEFEAVTLEMKEDMPRVYMATAVYYDGTAY